MKKTLSLILAMLMLLSAFTACSEGGTAAEDTTAAVSDTVDSTSDAPAAEDTEAEPAETTREDVKDGLGDYNFNGTSFRAAQPESSSYEFYAEELTGESTNDAVYNRNLRVEERFNAEIETINFANTTAVLTEVNNLVASGSDAFEVATHVAYKAYTPIGNGAYRNWYDVPTVDFTRPWWNNLANTQNTINGILYTATGDINITSLLNTYAMFFNMEVAANFGIMAADLYNYV
ncbi:MAG: acid shock protein, partial [Clostridia bacterium]|nr:acid shock protein [Clostridia bacterium]